MDCAAKAGSLKSGMAVAPPKASQKACKALHTFIYDYPKPPWNMKLNGFWKLFLQENIIMKSPAATKVYAEWVGPPLRQLWI